MFTHYILNEHLLCAGRNTILVKTTPQYDKLKKGIHKTPGHFEGLLQSQKEHVWVKPKASVSHTHTH